MRKGLLIRLLDDVVVSASAATAAMPHALPYIPGAMILGAAAAKASDDGLNMSGPEAFSYFHGGGFRFFDGMPVTPEGKLTFPLPLSIHRRKGSEARPCAGSGDVRDFAVDDLESGFEQIRDDACCADGTVHVVERMATLRTAIDVNTGRADEGQLFGYEALARGQYFWAGLEGEAKQVARVLDWLAGKEGKLHYLGRSRSSEFGRVEISGCDAWPIAGKRGSPGARYIWFLSDFMPLDENGMQTQRPSIAALHAKGDMDWSRSFVRYRRFAPFNAKWQKRAPERVLITRGSVLAATDCDLDLGLTTFGASQELGYGLAFVSDQPPQEMLRALEQPIVTLPNSQVQSGNSEVPELVRWLENRAAVAKDRNDLDARVMDEVDRLWQHYESARRLAGRWAGPGPSQWGRVSQGLLQGRSIDSVSDTEPWQTRFGVGDQATFGKFVANLDVRLLALVAKKMPRRLETEGWNDDT